VAGYTNSFGTGGSDVYLIKTDAGGDMIWSKTYGGGHADKGYAVAQTKDGGYIVVGFTYSLGAGGNDVYLIKTDSAGDMRWARTYGGIPADGGYAVAQTDDGGYIVGGYTESFGAGGIDVYLIKTDAIGHPLWSKTYGGKQTDKGYAVAQTDDGGYIVAGYTESFGAGLSDVYLIKTNSGGDILWTKTYGGDSTDYGYAVAQISDGGYIVTGFTKSFGAGSWDVYLIKTEPNGAPLWSKTYGGEFSDYGNAVTQTDDGGYMVAGITQSFRAADLDVYLIKIDADGNSGCNQRSTTTIVSSGGIVDTCITIVGSGAVIKTSPTKVDSPSIMDSTLCRIPVLPGFKFSARSGAAFGGIKAQITSTK